MGLKTRMIRPEFWTDEKIVLLTPYARLLFIGLWQLADDDGRFEWAAGRIKLQLFPADDLDIGPFWAELGGSGLVTQYSVGGKDYGSIPNFLKHQKIHPDRPSRLPPPPANSGPVRAGLGEFGPVRAGFLPKKSLSLPSPSPSPIPDSEKTPPTPPSGGEAASPPGGGSASPPVKFSPRKAEGRRKPEPLPDLPLPFDSIEFGAVWADWRQHRAEIRAPITPVSLRQQLARLGEMGEARAIAALKHSMANGWQGIFEEKKSGSGYSPRACDPEPDLPHLERRESDGFYFHNGAWLDPRLRVGKNRDRRWDHIPSSPADLEKYGGTK